jgi:hypothetical protein
VRGARRTYLMSLSDSVSLGPEDDDCACTGKGKEVRVCMCTGVDVVPPRQQAAGLPGASGAARRPIWCVLGNESADAPLPMLRKRPCMVMDRRAWLA